jgi:hypothetical protein
MTLPDDRMPAAGAPLGGKLVKQMLVLAEIQHKCLFLFTISALACPLLRLACRSFFQGQGEYE